jgi:hypothetical protein
MYAIKRRGRFLCWFTFRDGFDYRSKYEISVFAHVYGEPTITEEMKQLAQTYDGKIVKGKK